MIIEPLLLLVPLTLMLLLLWLNADKLYYTNRNLREKFPRLYKIIGYNEKYLDRPDLWVKHLRLFFLLFGVFLLSLLLWLFLAL